jgi:hypothetical protein
MEMSGFTEEQISVRDAIFKICSNYPDVRKKLTVIGYLSSSDLDRY